MTLIITAHEWSKFLTVAIACNQDGQRIAEECTRVVEYLESIARSLASCEDHMVDEADNHVIAKALIHLVTVHRLEPTKLHLWPDSLPGFGRIAVKIASYLETVA